MNLPDMFYASTLPLREQCAFMYKLPGLSVCVKVCACTVCCGALWGFMCSFILLHVSSMLHLVLSSALQN